MKTVFLVAIAISAMIATTQTLSCRLCSEVNCKPVDQDGCKGGLTRGICGCCDVCAKVKGEKCGGLWNIHGKCDRGLVCNDKKKGRRFRLSFGTGVCEAE